ncbi:MAG: DUF2189 domain-containing protein [Rubellimicrobium sp.]|nr:DUF2189 domain-containing protein [Rubellimicrobium sp.]
MTTAVPQGHSAPSPLPEIQDLRLRDLGGALVAGGRDFMRAPQFGLFFSAVYVCGGFLMIWLGAGQVAWVVATSLGFPLCAPFAAVGLYEVSRRVERGDPLDWRGVLGVVWDQRGRQVPWLGAIIVIWFLFWTFIAHMIFALFMGTMPIVNISEGWEILATPEGMTMVGVELAVGAAMAFVLYSFTVMSLPLLLDRELDFVTAMLHSISVVRDNLPVMLVWAALIAALTLAALVPWFLGLIVVLPVLGHATWHLYRRALK